MHLERGTMSQLNCLKKITSLIIIILLITSCVAQNGKINVSFNGSVFGGQSIGEKSSLVSADIRNNVLSIQGNHLNDVKEIRVKSSGGFDEVFIIESQSSSSITAKSTHPLLIPLNAALSIIIKDSFAATTYPLTFELQDGIVTQAKLHHMGANDGDVLTFNQTLGQWEPRNLSGLNFKGSWDARTVAEGGVEVEPDSSPQSGDYWLVSNPGNTDLDGTVNWKSGDWAIFNGTSWQKISNSSDVISFNGRQGAVVPASGDYTWADINKTTSSINDIADVDTSTVASGQVLKWNGTQWLPANDDTTAVAGSVGSSEIAAGAIDNSHVSATANIDQSKISNLTTDLAAKLSLAGGVMTGAIDMGGHNIGNVGTVDGVDISALNTVVGTNTTNISNKVDKTTTVNGQALSGNVTLTTSDVSEGTNLYFTNARAKAASVVNSTAGSETDQAASVDAMKNYVTTQVGAISSSQWTTNGSDIYYNAGGVGIGVLAPTEKLDIAGNIKVNGLLLGTGLGNDTTNTAFGKNALVANSTGWQNVAIGELAMEAAVGSTQNTAVGSYAMRYDTGSTNNVAVGTYALEGNQGGSYNTAVGVFALEYNTSGNDNVAVGEQALLVNSTGSNNVAVGRQSSVYNRTGSGNVTIGHSAGYGSSSVSDYSNNTIVGHRAGRLVRTAASNNVLIGYQAADSLTTGANNIVIGHDIDLPSAASANMLNIGNLIYGSGVDGSGTTVSTGNVGIGVVNPSSKLEVAGDLKVSSLSGSGTRCLQTDTNGVISLSSGACVTGGVGEVNTASNVGTAGVGVFKQKTSSNLEFRNIASNGAINVVDDSANNEIDIAVKVDNSTIEVSSDSLQIKNGGVDLTTKVTGVLPVLNGGTGASTASGARTNLGLGSSSIANAPALACVASEKVTYDGTNYVCATDLNSDATKLPLTGGTMSGAIAMGGNLITGLSNPSSNQDAATKSYVDSAISGSNLWTLTGADVSRLTGNVGIGIATPLSNFQVHRANGWTTSRVSSGDSGVQLLLNSVGTTGYDGVINYGSTKAFSITTDYQSSAAADFTILANGNVGIGTSSPAVELDVNTGTINAAFLCDENNSNCRDLSVPVAGDNLGNHQATQNLNLQGHKLVGSGGTSGLSINSSGAITFDGFMQNHSFNAGTITGLTGLSMNMPKRHMINVNANNSASYSSSSVSVATPDGNVGIYSGNSATADGAGAFYQLGANNAAGNEQRAYIGVSSNVTGYSPNLVFGHQTGLNSYSEVMRIDSSGNVGIGTTSPTSELDVVGDIQYTGVLTDVSDIRLKKDFEKLEGALEKINRVETYSYVMRNDQHSRREFGVIAQEIDEIFPELVKIFDKKDGLLSVNYIGLIPWTISAVQEVDVKIESNTRSIASVEDRIANLERENKELKEKLNLLIEKLNAK